MGEAVGAVKALWRFPVKSMRGEKVDVSDLTERGFVVLDMAAGLTLEDLQAHTEAKLHLPA